MEGKAQELLEFQIARQISNLFVSYLEVSEGLQSEHENMLNKIKSQIPANLHPIIDNLDYLDLNRKKLIRKQILDAGNRTLNGLIELVKTLDVEFSYNR